MANVKPFKPFILDLTCSVKQTCRRVHPIAISSVFSRGYAKKSRTASSSKWLERQSSDFFSREAKVRNLKSRAAFKLMDIDDRHRLFKPGMTVVDLGFAPGSWSQVAVERTKPNGRVIGVDILQHQPPAGASAIQGNFLSKSVQNELKRIVSNPSLGRQFPSKHVFADEAVNEQSEDIQQPIAALSDDQSTLSPQETIESAASPEQATSYLELERAASVEDEHEKISTDFCVDLVLSDMCEPWPQLHGFWLRSVNDPYNRMANTSGLAVRDHGMSMVC